PGTVQPPRCGHRFEPGLRECLRDGSRWPDAACAPLWVWPRLCAFINCVPTWSRPHRSRLSSPGDGAGSRSCEAATCVGARLSRSRTVPIRSQSQQLHYSSRTRRPLGSPGRARDHFGHICRHVFWWRTCHDAGGTAADCSRRRSPQRHRSHNGTTGLDADQKLCGKAPNRTQFRRARGNPALVIREAVQEARTPGLDRVCPAHLARAPRCAHAQSRSEARPSVARPQSGTAPDSLGPVRRAGPHPAYGYPRRQFRYAGLEYCECDAGTPWSARSRRHTGSGSRATPGRAHGDTADCSLCCILRCPRWPRLTNLSTKRQRVAELARMETKADVLPRVVLSRQVTDGCHLHLRERVSPMKSRKREIRTSGSGRDESGPPPHLLGRRKFLHLAAGAAALPAASRIARAKAYPTWPVRIIVPFPASQATDTIARLMGQSLSERLGQPFVIENRTGAGGNIGTESVVRATPDGYTLLLVGLSNAINATLYKKLNFNFIREIAPVASIGGAPYVMVINPSVPAKTVPEFIAYAKANPSKINMGSSGSGSVSHVFGERFKMMTGIDLVHVPYRGG